MSSEFFDVSDFDDLFDPDIIGDGPVAVGYFKAGGVPLKYAAAKYGVVGPNVGYTIAGGIDVATLWAKKGSASYSLSINGSVYSLTATAALGSTALVSVTFTTNSDGSWDLFASTSGGLTSGPTTNHYSGTWNTALLPLSICQVKYGITVTPDPSEPFSTGSQTNGAPNWVACSSAPSIEDSLSCGAQSGSHDHTATFTVQYRRTDTGLVFSTTTFYDSMSVDGSA